MDIITVAIQQYQHRPDWMRTNKYIPLANDQYSDFGQSKHTFMGGEIGKGLKSDPRVFKQALFAVPKFNRKTKGNACC